VFENVMCYFRGLYFSSVQFRAPFIALKSAFVNGVALLLSSPSKRSASSLRCWALQQVIAHEVAEEHAHVTVATS
jgi:hypothetical protein